MKLYEVTYTIKAVIAAEDTDDAYCVAQDVWRDVKGNQRPNWVCDQIEKALPHGWNAECFPYGPPAIDKRIKDYLP